MKGLQILTPLVFFLCIQISTLYSQGSIRGKVTDTDTGEPLIGANVFIKQTGQGTVTDLDGNFVLQDIPPGPYDIECTFLGYQRQRIVGVVVRNDGIKLCYFRLAEGEQEVDINVVVTAEAARNLEVAMLSKRKNSYKILETLSSEQIFQSGDENAGEALKHLTNISVENDNNVYIRGLGSRYVKTLLNGAEVPGLDLNTSSVQLDLFPSSIIDNIIVYKSYTPDQIGSFGGGYVEINTKTFPERFTIEFQAVIGAHSLATFNPNYRNYEGGRLDFLGIDDGTRDFPAQDLNIDATNPSIRDTINGLYDRASRFEALYDVNQRPGPPNAKLSFMVSNQINYKKGRSLSYGLVMLYKSQSRMYEDGFSGLYQLDGDYQTAFTLTPRLELSDKKYIQSVRNNILFNLAYKTRKSKISLILMSNIGTEKFYRDLDGISPQFGSDRRYRSQTWMFDQKQVTGTQLSGKHLSPNGDNKIQWQVAGTRSIVSQPDLRYFNYTYSLDSNGQAANYLIDPRAGDALTTQLPSRFNRSIEAYNLDGYINVTQNRPRNKLWKRFKWGLRGTLKQRDFDERRVLYYTDFANFNGQEASEFLAPTNHARWPENASQPDSGVYLLNRYVPNNSYFGIEATIAGYYMANMQLSDKTRLIAGLRTELGITGIVNYIRGTGGEVAFAQDTGAFFPAILPAVSIRHEIEKDMFLRASYSSTIARASLRELSPFTNFDYIGDYTITGNFDLANRPTTLQNIDLRWEVYPSKKEVVSAGAFFKYLNRPIEIVSTLSNPNQDFIFSNIPFAYLMGVELELRQGLGILGDWGKNIVMGANLGYIYSQARNTEEELNLMRLDNPEVSSFRPLFGQSPYVLNFLMNYNNEKIGLDVNASFHISGKKIVYVLVGNTPNIYEQPRGILNLNVAKHFNDLYHIRLSVENLLNAKLVQIQSFKGRTYSYRQHSLGTSIWLGFNYLLK